MNRPQILLCLVAGTLLAADLSAAAVPSVERSEQLRHKVEALLGPRRRRVALPIDPPNPFALAGSGVALSGADGNAARTGSPNIKRLNPRAERAEDSAEILARVASRLRIGGLIRLRDHMQIVINDSPWREGDAIMVEREPRPIQVHVLRIQPGELTLRLDEAELQIRF